MGQAPWEADYELLPFEGLPDKYFEMGRNRGHRHGWVEIRLDARKVARERRRPVAQRAQAVGIWFHILAGIAPLAVISNGSGARDLRGSVKFTLARAPAALTAAHNRTRRYRAFRGDDAHYSPASWNLLAIRLAFIFVFEVLGTSAGWSPAPTPPARTWIGVGGSRELALPTVTWSDAQSCGPYSSAGLSPGVRPPECFPAECPVEAGGGSCGLGPCPSQEFPVLHGCSGLTESRGRPRWARVLPRGCPLPPAVVFSLGRVLGLLVPDSPGSAEVKMKREHPLAKQALAENAPPAPHSPRNPLRPATKADSSRSSSSTLSWEQALFGTKHVREDGPLGPEMRPPGLPSPFPEAGPLVEGGSPARGHSPPQGKRAPTWDAAPRHCPPPLTSWGLASQLWSFQPSPCPGPRLGSGCARGCGS
ncbi:anoctamin-7 [Phacochoerus africanus]|uniref:anoctamin-7 n=1 Tax=Phacochoerus africanus TaxID=41426 RepID=UPI001FD8B096|nr:anoctamin-7 [Phacochoerus africanus]